MEEVVYESLGLLNANRVRIIFQTCFIKPYTLPQKYQTEEEGGGVNTLFYIMDGAFSTRSDILYTRIETVVYTTQVKTKEQTIFPYSSFEHQKTFE